MRDDFSDQEERNQRLRQRLWGAAVLIAILVIVLPLILDGSGSESQYRRVERLREEPPRVIDAAGRPLPSAPVSERPAVDVPVADVPVSDVPVSDVPRPENLSVESSPSDTRIHVGDDPPPGYYVTGPGDTEPSSEATSDVLTAWVVQAGSFSEQANALAVRDRLRRAGFPSFVTEADDGRTLFRVRVGPMIDAFRAAATRDAVIALLGREAIVVKYP